MPSINDIWNNGFIKLGEKYVDWYLAGRFELDQLADIASHREVLTEVYNVLVRSGLLVRIEKLELKEKNELWNECKPFTRALCGKDCIKFCKCYWALSYLTEKRNT